MLEGRKIVLVFYLVPCGHCIGGALRLCVCEIGAFVAQRCVFFCVFCVRLLHLLYVPKYKVRSNTYMGSEWLLHLET